MFMVGVYNSLLFPPLNDWKPIYGFQLYQKEELNPSLHTLSAFSPIPWWKALMKVDRAKFALGETCPSVAISTEVCMSLSPLGWYFQSQRSGGPSLKQPLLLFSSQA